MNRAASFLFLACFSTASLISTNVSAAALHVYAGAGLREPIEKIVNQFEQQTGHTVTVEYGGSGQILTRYKITGQGDLFIPGSDRYISKLEKDGLVSASSKLVRHIPVIAIRKDKAANIHSVDELAATNLRLGLGDSKAMALGRSGEKLLKATGHYDDLMNKVVVRAATVKQLALYLLNGDVDAAVIGRASAWKARDKVVMLPNPEGAPEETAAIALLKSSQHPYEAKLLMEKLTSTKGIQAFTDAGFLPLKPISN